MRDEERSRRALAAYAKEHGKALAQVQASMQPLLEFRATMERAMGSFCESQKNVGTVLASYLEEQRRTRELVRAAFPPFEAFEAIAQMQAEHKRILESVQTSFAPALEAFKKSFLELPPRTQKALLVLGQHGWYLDLELPLDGLWRVVRSLEAGDVDEAESALVEYFEGRVGEIEKFVVSQVPTRASVLGQAFGAHKRGEYALSVPVFIAQADGICAERTRQSLFRKDKGRPRTAVYVDRITENAYRVALLAPLTIVLPIGASKKERGSHFSGLNRHMVLHGESVDYGTKLNSLKALSLLNYIVGVLCADEENP